MEETTNMNTTNSRAVHLTVLGQKPISVGRWGCDYAWNDDFTAYRMLPHRWNPMSESSYIEFAYGVGHVMTDEERDEREYASVRDDLDAQERANREREMDELNASYDEEDCIPF